MHSVHVAAGRPVEDGAVIADALGEGKPQVAARPCSGRVSGLRAGLQRGVSADGQRKQPHPFKGREEGILRQSRYRKALGLLIVSVHCVAARLNCAIGCSCVAIGHSCVPINNLHLYVAKIVFCSEILLPSGDLVDLRPAPPPQQPALPPQRPAPPPQQPQERLKTAVSHSEGAS